jgi:hypothetical protein
MSQKIDQICEEVKIKGKIVIGRYKRKSERRRIHAMLNKRGLHSRTIDVARETLTHWTCHCGKQQYEAQRKNPSYRLEWGCECRHEITETIDIAVLSGSIEVSTNPFGGCRCVKCRAGIEETLSIIPQPIYEE